MPFEKYAAAAHALTAPSSAARALANGAPHIERVDKLVQTIASQHGIDMPELDRQIDKVDSVLTENRANSAS